jgi:hypothetical protein
MLAVITEKDTVNFRVGVLKKTTITHSEYAFLTATSVNYCPSDDHSATELAEQNCGHSAVTSPEVTFSPDMNN